MFRWIVSLFGRNMNDEYSYFVAMYRRPFSRFMWSFWASFTMSLLLIAAFIGAEIYFKLGKLGVYIDILQQYYKTMSFHETMMGVCNYVDFKCTKKFTWIVFLCLATLLICWLPLLFMCIFSFSFYRKHKYIACPTCGKKTKIINNTLRSQRVISERSQNVDGKTSWKRFRVGVRDVTIACDSCSYKQTFDLDFKYGA